MISGGSGTGKTTFAAAIAEAACARGETTLFFAFEESQAQIVRNMRSVGYDLERWIERRPRSTSCPSRPTQLGLERHLSELHRHVETPATRASSSSIRSRTSRRSGAADDIKAMLMRMVDFLKQRGITAVFTSLISSRRHGGSIRVVA